MKPYRANLINAIVLILMGLWGYFATEGRPPTALIPVGFGVVLLLATKGMVAENKMVAHVVVLLTAVLILMLVGMPFRKALGREEVLPLVRIGAMIGTSIFAFIVFIKSFIAAKKAREATT